VKKAAKKAKAFEIRKIVKCLKASEYAYFFSASKTWGHAVGRAFLREKRADKLVLEAELKTVKVCLEYFLSATANINLDNRSRADRHASFEE
jgi:hypothetical protein